MCLGKITERLKKPTTLVQDGWKEFRGGSGRLEFPNMEYKGNSKVPMDQWIVAEGSAAIGIAEGWGSYKPGFHVYDDEDEAKKLGARYRVYVRGIETRGTQNGKKVIVCREMYVPSDPDAWPPPDTIASSKGTA